MGIPPSTEYSVTTQVHTSKLGGPDGSTGLGVFFGGAFLSLAFFSPCDFVL